VNDGTTTSEMKGQNMKKHNGILQTNAQCYALAKKILAGGESQERKDAASILMNRPASILARPMLQPQFIALANSTDLSRKGGIMDILINGRS
jgi:hypothetical protein